MCPFSHLSHLHPETQFPQRPSHLPHGWDCSSASTSDFAQRCAWSVHDESSMDLPEGARWCKPFIADEFLKHFQNLTQTLFGWNSTHFFVVTDLISNGNPLNTTSHNNITHGRIDRQISVHSKLPHFPFTKSITNHHSTIQNSNCNMLSPWVSPYFHPSPPWPSMGPPPTPWGPKPAGRHLSGFMTIGLCFGWMKRNKSWWKHRKNGHPSITSNPCKTFKPRLMTIP